MVFLDSRAAPLRSHNGSSAGPLKTGSNGHGPPSGQYWPQPTTKQGMLDRESSPGASSLKYYWNSSTNPFYNLNNGIGDNQYAATHTHKSSTLPPSISHHNQQQQQRRQYQPFPLNLPHSGTPTPQPRGLPRQGSPPGAYQNVSPQTSNGGGLPRQAIGSSRVGASQMTFENPFAHATPARSGGYGVSSTLNGNSTNQQKASRTVPVVRVDKPTSGVWTTQSDPSITQIRRATPPRTRQEKTRSVQNRSKPPRWGRWMQSFCCCMAPQQEIEPVKTTGGKSPVVPVLGGPQAVTTLVPITSAASLPVSTPCPTTPAPTVSSTASQQPLTSTKANSDDFESLITQVNKDGSVTVPPPTQAQLRDSEVQIKTLHPGAIQNGTSSYAAVTAAQNNLQNFIEPYKPTADKLLLPPLRPSDVKKKCLIIDLDETLVHSSFKPVKNPDFVIPVEIDGVVHQVYVLKRPFVDEFLAHVGEKYECVLFTASLAKYADPVADLLDKRAVFRSRLFREACVFHKGNYVKDLARLGRDLNKVLIMDNSPASYAFHPENAIAVQTWFDDPHDVELLEVLPLLDRLAEVDSVYTVLRQSESPEPRSDRSSSP